MPHKVVPAFVAILAAIALVVVGGAAIANASPGDWSNAPGYTEDVSSGQPAGTLISSEEIATPPSVKVRAKTYILTYEDGTGQITKQTVIVPDREFDGDGVRPALVNIQPTDSLNPEKAPSRDFEKGDGSVDELSSQWLNRGGAVIIPDSYGHQNPTYAGVSNGVRIKNGMLAFQAFTTEQNPMVTAGFSGGGVDSAHVAEDTTVVVPNYRGSYISGAPANMTQVVLDSDGQIQSGLIMGAAMPGVQRSLSNEDKAMLDAKVRPSAKVFFQVLNLGGAGSDMASLLGPVGIRTSWLFRDGGFEDPAVRTVFDKASLGHNAPTVPVAVAGSLDDPWMVWDHNGKPLAAWYQENGTDVTVMTSDESHGHADMPVDRQLSWLDDQLPADSKLQEPERVEAPNPLLEPVVAVLNDVMQSVSDTAIGTLTQVAPVISEAIDPAMVTGLNAADALLDGNPEAAIKAVIPAPTPAPALVQPATEAPADNVSTIANVATQYADPAAQAVIQQAEQVVRGVPALEDAINGLQLPALP